MEMEQKEVIYRMSVCSFPRAVRRLLLTVGLVVVPWIAGAQSFPEAVDATNYVWTLGGEGAWIGQSTTTHDGIDAGESPGILDLETAWFQTSVTGPVTVTFWWKVDCEDFDNLSFYIDALTTPRDQIAGNQDWQQVSYSIDPGVHLLRWEFAKDYSDSNGADRGWVDQITITPPQALPLVEVLDATQFVWTTGGNVDWAGQTTIAHDTVDAAKSGSIVDDQYSFLETSITGPVVVAFWWRVDSEVNYDFLTFAVDGYEQNSISGSVDWQYQSFTIGAGVHTARWTYAKDSSGSSGADAAWVDEFATFPIPVPATRYVWLNSPAPMSPYTNWQTAARSIQQAVDVAQGGDVILVTNGNYAAGSRALSITSLQRNRVLIYKPVTVRSINGPAFTAIVGAPDALISNGTRSIRCAYVTNGATLSGFTLTNGYSAYHGGGAFCEAGGILSNCVIAGNKAVNSSGGGGSGGSYYNCAFAGNAAILGGAVSSGAVINCTIAGNSALIGGGTHGGVATNSIVYFNTAASSPEYTNTLFVHSCTRPAPGGDHNITNNPLFAGSATGNLRLTSSSPCINAGTNAFWMTAARDLDGNTRIAGGIVDMGAYEYIATASGYDLWAGSITNGLTNYNQSATGDGYPNLLKYATGSSPTNADTLARMEGSRTNGVLALLFHRNTNATDVTLVVETGEAVTNGSVWTGIATNRAGSWGGNAQVAETGTGSPVNVVAQDTGPGATNRFMRLRVTRP